MAENDEKRLGGNRRSVKHSMAQLAERMLDDEHLGARMNALASAAQDLGFNRREVIEAVAVAEAEGRLTFEDHRDPES